MADDTRCCLDIKTYQQDVDAWTSQFTPQYWPPEQMIARMIEETGEVAREINHLYGIKKKKPSESESSLGQELSDVIFTAVCLMNSYGMSMRPEIPIDVGSKVNWSPYLRREGDDESLIPYRMLSSLNSSVASLSDDVEFLEEGSKGNCLYSSVGISIADLFTEVSRLACFHSIDIDAEWKKMLDKKLYGRDNGRYEKVHEK